MTYCFKHTIYHPDCWECRKEARKHPTSSYTSSDDSGSSFTSLLPTEAILSSFDSSPSADTSSSTSDFSSGFGGDSGGGGESGDW